MVGTDNINFAIKLKDFPIPMQRLFNNNVRISNTKKMIVQKWLDDPKSSPNESNSESSESEFKIYLQTMKISNNNKVKGGFVIFQQ